MTRKIKLFDPYINHLEEKAISKTLKSKFWASGSGVGKVREFEKKFNKFVGSDDCIAVNSGTAALHLALSLTNLENKEVILPSLSFVSTAHAIIYNGGKPKFVEVDENSLCLDVAKAKEAITKKTAAILPVHFGGMPCNLSKFQNLCIENKIDLIEDAAHATGAIYKNKRIGCHGKAVCFSFHPVKNLAMPTGGAITLNDKDSKKMKKIIQEKRWCGITNRKGVKYDVTDLGWNYYMNEFSASIGLIQLQRLDKVNTKRKKIAKIYCKEINLETKMPFNEECVYHLYWIRVKNREKFMRNMKRGGIEIGVHYKPIHQMSFYSSSIKLPITDEVGKEIVSLPIHPNLSDADVDYIVKMTNRQV